MIKYYGEKQRGRERQRLHVYTNLNMTVIQSIINLTLYGYCINIVSYMQ